MAVGGRLPHRAWQDMASPPAQVFGDGVLPIGGWLPVGDTVPRTAQRVEGVFCAAPGRAQRARTGNRYRGARGRTAPPGADRCADLAARVARKTCGSPFTGTPCRRTVVKVVCLLQAAVGGTMRVRLLVLVVALMLTTVSYPSPSARGRQGVRDSVRSHSAGGYGLSSCANDAGQ